MFSAYTYNHMRSYRFENLLSQLNHHKETLGRCRISIQMHANEPLLVEAMQAREMEEEMHVKFFTDLLKKEFDYDLEA